MNLPDRSDIFVASVVEDCKRLIGLGIWDIPVPSFNGWVGQFLGPQEEFFSACLLSQLLLRSNAQFESGLKSLFRGSVSRIVYPSKEDSAFCDHMRDKRDDPRIRLVPVICETDPPTKSGPLVLRRLQRILNLNSKWMIWPWQAAAMLEDGSIDSVVFVDDFLGSGSQFEKFVKQWRLEKYMGNATYAAVAASDAGMAYLNGLFPTLNVCSSEILDQSHGFFSESVWLQLGGGCITPDDARIWYEDFGERRGFVPKSVGAFGVGDLALTLGFAHSTPNNSLPVLWYRSPTWQPLLER